MAEDEQVQVYVIPKNFVDGGRVLNGLFKRRNFIEGVGLALIVAFPLWQFPFPSFAVKLSTVISCALPLFLLGNAGINGDPLSTFVKYSYGWLKAKRVMLNNGQVRARKIKAIDLQMAQEQPKDKLLNTIDAWKEKKSDKREPITFIEGENFEFEEDAEFEIFKNIEKRMLEENEKLPELLKGDSDI